MDGQMVVSKLKAGDVVEVYEDPLTMVRKEGNAKVIEHVIELEPGVDQYKVNFFGDDPETVVVRTIAKKPLCIGIDSNHCDDRRCKVHGVGTAHWVGAPSRQVSDASAN